MCAVASYVVSQTLLGSGTEPEKVGEMFCVFMGSGAVYELPEGKKHHIFSKQDM